MTTTSLPIIRDLNISKEILKQVTELQESSKYSPYFKRKKSRELLNCTFCAGCASTPEIEVSYNSFGIKRIENWCRKCYQLSLDRTALEPTTIEETAAYYNCKIAEPGTTGKAKR